MTSQLLYGALGPALIVCLIAVRTLRWRYLSTSRPMVTWATDRSSNGMVSAADIVWLSARFDPARLASLIVEFASNAARQRLAHGLLHSMQVAVDRLRQIMAQPDLQLAASDITYIDIALGIDDCIDGALATTDQLQDQLIERISAVSLDADPGPASLGFSGEVLDVVDHTLDSFSLIGLTTTLALIRHARKVARGKKSVSEAVADGSIEVAASMGGAATGLLVVSAAADTVTFGAATVAMFIGRSVARGLLQSIRYAQLRSFKATLVRKVGQVGAELYRGDRHTRLQAAIRAPSERDQRAVATLSQVVRHNRLQARYWIWPSPRHVLCYAARRQGKQAAAASRREAAETIRRLKRIDASANRNVLAGQLLVRSARLQAELGIPSDLIKASLGANNDVVVEAARLRDRYG